MHTLSLGVFQQFILLVLHLLFAADAWAVRETTEIARLITSCLRLRAELFTWYRVESRAGRHHCQLQDLTQSMVGTSTHPVLHLKAAETNSFLVFLAVLIAKYAAALEQADVLVRMCRCLLRCVELIRLHSRRFPAEHIQEHTPNTHTHTHTRAQEGPAKVQ